MHALTLMSAQWPQQRWCQRQSVPQTDYIGPASFFARDGRRSSTCRSGRICRRGRAAHADPCSSRPSLLARACQTRTAALCAGAPMYSTPCAPVPPVGRWVSFQQKARKTCGAIHLVVGVACVLVSTAMAEFGPALRCRAQKVKLCRHMDSIGPATCSLGSCDMPNCQARTLMLYGIGLAVLKAEDSPQSWGATSQ